MVLLLNLEPLTHQGAEVLVLLLLLLTSERRCTIHYTLTSERRCWFARSTDTSTAPAEDGDGDDGASVR
jgi:hypothetical protein